MDGCQSPATSLRIRVATAQPSLAAKTCADIPSGPDLTRCKARSVVGRNWRSRQLLQHGLRSRAWPLCRRKRLARAAPVVLGVATASAARRAGSARS
eukprot:scaffold9338_cov113-Isochrysis_galbana.AAC.6